MLCVGGLVVYGGGVVWEGCMVVVVCGVCGRGVWWVCVGGLYCGGVCGGGGGVCEGCMMVCVCVRGVWWWWCVGGVYDGVCVWEGCMVVVVCGRGVWWWCVWEG